MLRSVIALCCVVVAACGSPETEAPEPAAVPVFIISIDALRADRLPAYGYAHGSTPAIDRLRRDSILFSTAVSNSPQTLTSHASIFTGTLPPVHGIRNDFGYRLTAATPTIASSLRQSGYGTAAAVSTYLLRRGTGIGEGFELYDDRVGAAIVSPSRGERDGEEARVALTSWLDRFRGSRVFAFLHLNEPRAPYAAPDGFRAVADDYDNEIAYADEVVGRFLETLRSRGWYDDALIILLSDHGEGFGEHGEEGHGLFVYRESIHVPLLVKLPGGARAGETVTRPVGLHQVAGLVLSIATGTGDRSLLDESGGPAYVYSETYYPRLQFGWSELRSLITAERHFIDAPRRELYDHVADPGETRNLERSEGSVADEMLRTIRTIDTGFRPPADLDPDERGSVPAGRVFDSRSGARRNSVDPKDKVQIVRDLRRARSFFESRRYRDAIPLLERVVFAEPAIVDGWALLGRSRAANGQRLLALEAYREGLRHFPENTDLALLAAEEYAAGGNWAAAEKLALSLVAQDPALSHETLARFAMRRGLVPAAREHAETAVRQAPGRISLLMLLAELSRRAERPAEQLMWLDRAAQETAARSVPPVEGLQFQRGTALETLDRGAEAEAAYRAEVGQSPSHAEAWRRLAMLLAGSGRADEARALIEQARRADDTPAMRILARDVLAGIDGMAPAPRSPATP